MDSSPFPEQERLETLYGFEILDTAYEAAFDDLVEMAAYICGTPMSSISLIDVDRQWFKAQVGMPARESSREFAFCSYAVGQGENLVVEDALQDDVFATNPLVVGEPHIRFYAGALLRAENGAPLGTICVLDTEARQLSTKQLDALDSLSRQVVRQMEGRQAVARLRKAMEARVSAEALRDKLINELESALREVKTLGGLLPICAHCKKVRDDNGYWESVEDYLSARTGASFSHSVCPECVHTEYPDFARRNR